MRLASSVTKSVLFVGILQGNEFKACGTMFLLAGKKYGGGPCNYMVTAAHVAKAIERDGLSIRYNKRGGGSEIWEVPVLDWTYDMSCDLAMAVYDAPACLDAQWIPDSSLFCDDKIASKRVEAGTPAYVVGLFKPFPGIERNVPLVHTGHIALLPDQEKVGLYDRRCGLNAQASCYLVQIQALPGCSGAPVFLRRPVKTFPVEDTGMFPEAYGSPFLLGLWHGSWKRKPDEEMAASFDLVANETVPTSFGIVIPAQRIVDMLESKEMKAKQARAAREDQESRAPTADLAFSGKTAKQVDDEMKRFLKKMLATPAKKRGKEAD